MEDWELIQSAGILMGKAICGATLMTTIVVNGQNVIQHHFVWDSTTIIQVKNAIFGEETHLL
jgi:hypothetical protein